ncbi:hypothetical protein ACFPL7_11045 [Dongia soli]|uniref:Uncharacterized protein n=1 Tax=Dongia soli TaxID=600628 RepID=A0ABU5EAW4_9PROT|nr:hypothetical protein [Dongia soli]MDY0883486.1 hypothetical protein [Dongia soli]
MARNRELRDFSQLEREFELEMEDAGSIEQEFDDMESDEEFEEDEADDEAFELDEQFEQDEEFESVDDESGDASGQDQEYVERFLEIAAREFESESEVDQAMNEVLDDMSREYLFGGLVRGIKKLSKNKILRSLAKKGLKYAAGKFFPGVEAAMQLAKGNVKGALLNIGKQALGTVVPGGTATLDAVKSLGLAASEYPERNQQAWENYVTLAREAYEYLADNVTENADRPAEAARLANNAMRHAITRAQSRAASMRRLPGRGMRRRGRHGYATSLGQTVQHGQARVIRLKVAPGQRIKLIIIGR